MQFRAIIRFEPANKQPQLSDLKNRGFGIMVVNRATTAYFTIPVQRQQNQKISGQKYIGYLTSSTTKVLQRNDEGRRHIGGHSKSTVLTVEEFDLVCSTVSLFGANDCLLRSR